MRSACLYGSSLGLCLAQVVLLSHLGRILGLCWANSGPCWAMLGPSWAYIGPGWAYVGLCWAHLGPMSGLCWAHPCWPPVGLCWAYVVRCWAILGPMLGPSLGHLFWNDLKIPIFPARASWSPKPRKKQCFLNTASTKHRKLRRLQWFGSAIGWTGDGSAAGPAAPITFRYHRKPPARTRAGLVAGTRI